MSQLSEGDSNGWGIGFIDPAVAHEERKIKVIKWLKINFFIDVLAPLLHSIHNQDKIKENMFPLTLIDHDRYCW